MTNGEWIVKNNYKFEGIQIRNIENGGCTVQFGKYGIKTVYAVIGASALALWLDEIHKNDPLTQNERKYLSTVIEPFHDKVQGIAKYQVGEKEYLKIYIDGDSDIELPRFAKGTMYSNMLDREYMLEELGL